MFFNISLASFAIFSYLCIKFSIARQRDMKYRLYIALLAALTGLRGHAQPFSIAERLFDSGERSTLGLERAPGAETVTVFAPSDESDHYANGVVMSAFKGRLYCMWQSSEKDEDSADTWVAYSSSHDGGKTWSKPARLVPGQEGCFLTSGGWLATEQRLVAFVNVWRTGTDHKTAYTAYTESEDGTAWSEMKPVTRHDGTPLCGIMEQDPRPMADGRIIGAVHLMPGMALRPIYTDDPTGRTGWRQGYFTATPNGKQTAELEPSFFTRDDQTLVMTMRDQRGSHRILAAESSDRGVTWTRAAETNMPDSRAKQCAGNLEDGTAYIVNNPVAEKKPRTPLAITLSRDGKTFDKAYLLRSGDSDDLPRQRYEGKYKTIGYSYPKAMTCGGWLYVAYSTNKELVQYTRVKMTALMR